MPYAIRSRTHSDVRIIRHERTFLAYVFYSTATYVLSVAYVSTTYAISRHTYSSAVDVRILARTSLREIQIRDYAVAMESGLHSGSGFGTHSGSDEEDDPLGPSGLSLASKFTIDTFAYIYVTLIIKLQLSCYVSHCTMWCPMFRTTPPKFRQ